MFGQDEKDLVPHPDSLIVLVEDLAPNGLMVRCKPASYAAILQVSVDALRKFIILARIAYET
jgi:hypothetical protein